MATDSDVEDVATLLSESMYTVASYLSLFLGLYGLFRTGVTVAGGVPYPGMLPVMVVFVVSLGFLALSAVVHPRSRDRIERRGSIREFGSRKAVRSRRVSGTDTTGQTCTVCLADIDSGVVRERREELIVAGVPIKTRERSDNYYCRRCAGKAALRSDSATDATEQRIPESNTSRT